MVAEQAFLAPRVPLETGTIAAASMAVAAVAEICGVALRTFAQRQRDRKAGRVSTDGWP